MKNLIIAANWKSNKGKSEAREWLDGFKEIDLSENMELVLFAPFTMLDYISSYISENNLNLKLGAQDISPYTNGAYTGEVNADQVKEFAQYVLIGHSERRIIFNESLEMVNSKIDKATSADLTPIVCFSNLNQIKNISNQNLITAYEPLEAIGTDNPDDPKHTEKIASQAIAALGDSQIIYGGSINSDNIKKYISIDKIEGVLVGAESLDITSFSNIIKNAI